MRAICTAVFFTRKLLGVFKDVKSLRQFGESMNIVRLALKRPISVIVVVIALTLVAVMAVLKMPRDILPNLGVPTIYVVQPYGGMDPSQMESYITYYYESFGTMREGHRSEI
jgi:hypothetical protein